MKMKIYSVFDTKVANYGRPWYAYQDAAAIREFSDAVNDASNPANQWNKHPEDFQLFCIGAFDDATGALSSHAPLALINAAAVFSAKLPMEPQLIN